MNTATTTWVTRGQLVAAIDALRERGPLVHCLTSTVSMGLVADGLRAAGARPMMTETIAEAPAMVTAANALLVNLGTLSSDARSGIPATVAVARQSGVPWVLDPAAVGIAPLRTELAWGLLGLGPAVVRANASEVSVLVGSGAAGSGPDATKTRADDSALALARIRGCIVSVSGPVDFITDGDHRTVLQGGSDLLPQVTGTGCLLGALSAAFMAVTKPPVAAVAAAALLAVSAERAAQVASAPGSFRIALLDALYCLSAAHIAEQVQMDD